MDSDANDIAVAPAQLDPEHISISDDESYTNNIPVPLGEYQRTLTSNSMQYKAQPVDCARTGTEGSESSS